MAIEFSAEMKNKAAEGYGVTELLKDLRIDVRSGGPAGVELAPTGNLLNTYTLASGVFTSPTRATFLVTLSGGAGSVDTLTLGGSLFNLLGGAISVTPGVQATSADLIVAAINGTFNPWGAIAAAASADVVTVSLPYWLGAQINGLTIAHTETTTTVAINGGSSVTVGGTGSTAGISAVNGLNFLFPAVNGLLSKEATAWSGVVAVTGTAGHFRAYSGGSTPDGVTGNDVRFEGLCGTSGSDLNLTSLSLTALATDTITQFDLNVGTC